MPCVRNWNTAPTAVTRVVTGDLVCYGGPVNRNLRWSSAVTWCDVTEVKQLLASRWLQKMWNLSLFQSKCWQNSYLQIFSPVGTFSHASAFLSELILGRYFLQQFHFVQDKEIREQKCSVCDWVQFLEAEAAAGDDPLSIWCLPDGPAMWKVSVRPLTHWIVDQTSHAVALKRLWPGLIYSVSVFRLNNLRGH